VSYHKQSLARVARRQHADHVFHGHSHPPDDRLALEDRGINRNALQQFIFRHNLSLAITANGQGPLGFQVATRLPSRLHLYSTGK
jgi:hypothetical protein